jgi:arabinan endo-1,5-alpha-L-arabinosidase
MKLLLSTCILLGAVTAMADMITNPPVAAKSTEPLITEKVLAHDPVIACEKGVYYLFTTGPGVTIWHSRDMHLWVQDGRAYPDRPSWANQAVIKFNGHLWGPDISYFHGSYYLYYAVSAFGGNRSCIGLATNKTMDPTDPAYKWEDHGILLESFPGRDNWNAIDPQLILGDKGEPYLAFGSFWSGLKLARLSPDGMSVLDDKNHFVPIASREHMRKPGFGKDSPLEKGDKAIEGPFIYKHGDYYYLFASIGYCCLGPKSTYRMVFGRSKSVTGPYYDADGVSMLEGGGTLLLKGDKDWYGVGGNSAYNFNGIDYLVFHGYDASEKEALPKLRIEVLKWNKEGWPTVAGAAR